MFKALHMRKMLIGVVSLMCFFSFGEDGYIESDGTQYVNTGHFVGPETKLEIDFSFTEITSQCRPMGVRGADNGLTDPTKPRCELYVGKNSTGDPLLSYNLSKVDGSRQANNCYLAETGCRYVVTMDLPGRKWKVEKDGVSVDERSISSACPEARTIYPLTVFAVNCNTSCIYTAAESYDLNKTFANSTKMRLYGLKISEDGTLVKNFVPCVKGGVAGLKETISGRFFTSERYGSLTYGGAILEEKDDPYIWTPRNTLDNINNMSVYLETKYHIGKDSRIELDFAPLTPECSSTDDVWGQSHNPYIFTTYGTTDGRTDSVMLRMVGIDDIGSTGKFIGKFAYSVGKSGARVISDWPIQYAYGIRRTVSVNSNSISVVTAGYTNYFDKVEDGKETVLPVIPNNTLRIGAQGTGSSRYLPMKIYGYRVYEADVLVKDYRPFVSNAVAGLVNSLDASDILTSCTRVFGVPNDGFHTNVVFDAGGAITDDRREMEAYLEFDGVSKHSIDTGYVVAKDSCIEADLALWSTHPMISGTTGQDVFGQAKADGYNGIWARLTFDTAQKWICHYRDYVNGVGQGTAYVTTTVQTDNARKQFKVDGYNSRVTISSGGKTLFDSPLPYANTATTASEGVTLRIGCSYAGTTRGTAMRLYSFRISERGDPVRNYVPYRSGDEVGLYCTITGDRKPLVGGKVYGSGFNGTYFQIAPQPTRMTRGDGERTLKCLAVGAQSYEWYVDGEKIAGETGETCTVNWTGRKPHIRTYSVVPVYNVFNETVRGDSASADVEFTPFGIVITVQ